LRKRKRAEKEEEKEKQKEKEWQRSPLSFSFSIKEPRVETQGRVLNPISYEKPDLTIQSWCQI
jgi:hypothetical protein